MLLPSVADVVIEQGKSTRSKFQILMLGLFEELYILWLVFQLML